MNQMQGGRAEPGANADGGQHGLAPLVGPPGKAAQGAERTGGGPSSAPARSHPRLG